MEAVWEGGIEQGPSAGEVGMRGDSARQPRQLFIFEFHFQGCMKPRDELSHVILPVCLRGEIAALAPTRTEIVKEWLARLCRREGQQIRDWWQALVVRGNELRLSRLGQRGAFFPEFLDLVREHDRASYVSTVPVGGLPITHPTLFLVLGDRAVAWTLRDADPDFEPWAMAPGEHAFDASHVGTSVDADALRLGDFFFSGIPGIIGQLEFGTDGPSCDDSCAAVIARHVVSMIVPNAEATTTSATPDAIIVQPFAVIVVIIAVLVPLVDHQGARALDPDIHATADRALGWNQVLLVHTMCDSIALPRHVAVALADLPRVSFHNRLRHGSQNGSVHDVVGSRFPRCQTRLENEGVQRPP